MGLSLTTQSEPALEPKWYEKSKYDPLLGFRKERKVRTTLLTEDEMMAAGIPARYRDYCADYLVAVKKCKKEYTIMSSRFCQHQRHALNRCRIYDINIRMKDYERERRLMQREVQQQSIE